MSGWQPFSTAPKDGKCFLVWLADEGCATLALWSLAPPEEPDATDSWWLPAWDVWQEDAEGLHTFSHWMPLPLPPEPPK